MELYIVPAPEHRILLIGELHVQHIPVFVSYQIIYHIYIYSIFNLLILGNTIWINLLNIPQ